MTLIDIRQHLSKLLDSKGFTVFTENINRIKRPCVFIDIIDDSSVFDKQFRQNKIASIDILYFGKGTAIADQPSKADIITNLETIDLAFQDYGKKYLKVLDRKLMLQNQSKNITDFVGHYIFDLNFFDTYGTNPNDYYNNELMNNLEATYKEG